MLIFVYNADSGLMNAFKDYVHKEVSPSTYPCSLCSITYGKLGMKREWSEFVDGLDIDVDFLHIDEFEKEYPGRTGPYPSCFSVEKGKISRIITSDEFDNCEDLEDIKELVSMKIENDR